jgi:hypothetical protein
MIWSPRARPMLSTGIWTMDNAKSGPGICECATICKWRMRESSG